jgi:integrase
MPRAYFTSRNVATLPAPARGVIDYADDAEGAIPWFELRVTAKGKRTFTVGYRVGRRKRRVRLGTWPSVSLAGARERARGILAEVTQGRDPAAERDNARRAADLGALATRFIDDREPNLAPNTIKEYRRILSSEIEHSMLARVAAQNLARADVREFLEAIARRAPVMANRVFQFVRAVFRWAVAEDLLPSSPFDGKAIKRPRREKPRERILANSEVKSLWVSLGEEKPVVAAVVQLLLLLGQRSTETVEMRWRDLRLEGNVPAWSIPGRFRKGGRQHVVPPSPLAIRVLEKLRSLSAGSERVFEGVSEVNAERDWWGKVRARAMAAGAEHFTKHDLRHTCATGCAVLGASESTISRILGHKVIAGTLAVTAIYDQYSRLPEMATALNTWASHVEQLVGIERMTNRLNAGTRSRSQLRTLSATARS